MNVNKIERAYELAAVCSKRETNLHEFETDSANHILVAGLVMAIALPQVFCLMSREIV